VLAYALGAAIATPAVGVAAAAVSAALPPAYSRLLFAMWPTLAGHLFDVLAILAAALYVREPSRRRLALLAAAVFAAMLSYISSLFTMTAFLLALAALERRHARALLAVLFGAGTAAVLALYGPFVHAFVTEIVPALLRGGAPAGPPPATPRPRPEIAVARFFVFFGAVPLLAAIAGGMAAVRRARVLAAWALALLVLILLRVGGGGIFDDLKEITFASTLVALGAASAVAALHERFGRAVAAMVLVGIVASALHRADEVRRGYVSPITAPARMNQ
jgi:hypothetical protein